ncbi:hypothetical protein HL653_17215 [Sphingomonas sp. AP4-R1]|uniref:hypothetical protein n=1 Tax=Sphingomonas sp. AP4-R1 TaxID=2735134 RepID=UPI00149367AB|nr:hypothetical protein [Sphingomonas sp. AP4-R1]QJU60756.1 hypothetical protein HL653_17215 [Sphingomonas sp. AP4-R1]
MATSASAKDRSAVPSTGAVPRSAMHPVSDGSELRASLGRVPVTRDFPPDFADTLRKSAPIFIVEMSTAPGCVPCGDLWSRLQMMRTTYGLRIALITPDEAMLRSGRFGLPWVGHPLAWARAIEDPNRAVPVAIGTDHAANVARNIYLAFKMMTGVRAAVGVRAMAKYTGIVGVSAPPPPSSRR